MIRNHGDTRKRVPGDRKRVTKWCHWRMTLKLHPYWQASLQWSTPRRAMTVRENIRKAGVTEGCFGCKTVCCEWRQDWSTFAVMPNWT